MKAVRKLLRALTFDGVDDYISVNNSGTAGSPYDFEYNTPFSYAFKFKIHDKPLESYYTIYAKDNQTKGYGTFISLLNRPNNLFVGSYLRYNGGTNYQIFAQSLLFNIEYILVFSYDGLSLSNSCKLSVFHASNLTAAGTYGTIGSISATSIKTIQPVEFGRAVSVPPLKYFGSLEQVVSLNSALSSTQIIELAGLIKNDKIQNFTLFNNIVGYWPEFGGGKAINNINRAYDGTLINF